VVNTVSTFSSVPADAYDIAPYRAISRSAIMAAVMAAISLPLVVLAVVSMRFQVGDAVPLGVLGAVFAAAAVLLGVSGLRTIRKYPTEYTGLRLARSGLVGGLVLSVGGVAAAAITYTTEVPDGYSRVGFGDLQPDPDYPNYYPISPKAVDISGKPIFIKGYMHPGVASMGKVNHFILVPDMGTCCFGGQPKATDMIEVYIPDGKERVAYSARRLELAGTFAVDNQPTQSLGLSGVWYHLKADQVK
jgi:hypothetical protein